MDQVRQIRYLVAPFFFFASLLWGSYLDHRIDLSRFPSGLVPLLVASFFPIGFLIGAISHVIVWFIFWIFEGRSGEVPLDLCSSRQSMGKGWSQ